MIWYEILLAFFGGLCAGGINILAGNGSVITLSLLTELFGLPGNLANGTNRIGICAQNGAGTSVFIKKKSIHIKENKDVIILMLLGAFLGIYFATQISNVQFKEVFKYLLLVIFVIVLLNPKKWLKDAPMKRQLPLWLIWPLYFLLGLYGGFIQMGTGIFFMAVMVLMNQYPLLETNALKTFIIFCYTLVALIFFNYHGMVSWSYGIPIAVGQGLGGFLTARFASNNPKANKVAYTVLIVVLAVALVRIFFFS